jgi:Aldo/keto reductase family
VQPFEKPKKSLAFLFGDRRVKRLGYGAMQLAGPGVFGPLRDHDAALAVLREAVAAGVDHIDTSDFYGPHVVNRLIREALAPYPRDLVIVTKVGAVRGDDGSWNPAQEPDQLRTAVEDNLRLDRLEELAHSSRRSGARRSLGRKKLRGARNDAARRADPPSWPQQRDRCRRDEALSKRIPTDGKSITH